MSTRIKKFIIDKPFGNGKVYDWAELPKQLSPTVRLLIVDANPEDPGAYYLGDQEDLDDPEVVVGKVKAIWVDYNPASLDELYSDIKAGKVLEDWNDMPSFGFKNPRGAIKVWAYDGEDVLIGNDARDIELIPIEEWEWRIGLK